MPANLENSAVATGLEKISFYSNPKERQCQRMLKIALISHTSKVMLKILQVRLQQHMNHELSHVQAGFRKGRGTRDQIANIHWITEKARDFQKNIYFCFIDYAKALCREMGIPDHLTCLMRNLVCRSRSSSWNWTWNNGLVPNWKRSTSRLYTVTVLI